MSPVKRVGLMGMLVLLGMLFAPSPALAKPKDTSVTLTPPESSPEPLASGRYSCSPLIPRDAVFWEVYVTCSNLTPGEGYKISVYDYIDGETNGVWATANSKGKLSPDPIISWSNVVHVWVEDSQGAVVLVPQY